MASSTSAVLSWALGSGEWAKQRLQGFGLRLFSCCTAFSEGHEGLGLGVFKGLGLSEGMGMRDLGMRDYGLRFRVPELALPI